MSSKIVRALAVFVLTLLAGAAALFTLVDNQADPSRSAQPNRPPPARAQQSAPALSPTERYIGSLLEFQYHFVAAHRAGLCRIRSDAYFLAFRIARDKLQIEAAQKFELSPQQVGLALDEVNRRFAKANEGVPEFNVIEGCAYLRSSPSIDKLDEVYRQITGNYH